MNSSHQSDSGNRGGQASIVTIDATRHGQRLDNFLMNQLRGVPRSHVYRLLRSGQVRVNSGRKKPHYRLKNGDRVRIPPVRIAEKTTVALKPETLHLLDHRILFDSPEVLVVDKPGGLPVHAGSGCAWGIIDILRQRWPGQSFELVHRLDRETSGCLLLARTRAALNTCHTVFREQHSTLAKHYIALVRGHWAGSETVVTGIEKVLRGGERMIQVAAEGARAISHFECERLLEHNGMQASLMRIRIDTGRTHQIRVHAQHRQHPLAGDGKYGDREFNQTMKTLGLKRLFLHASKLSLQLPGIGHIHAEAPLPEDLRAVADSFEW